MMIMMRRKFTGRIIIIIDLFGEPLLLWLLFIPSWPNIHHPKSTTRQTKNGLEDFENTFDALIAIDFLETPNAVITEY